MAFKFEKLEVWQLALEYVDMVYEIADLLPKTEDFNLKSQIKRAATSVALNVAEGSTGQSDAEQAKFVGYAIRSVVETVACQHIINRRQLIGDTQRLRNCYAAADKLTAKLQAFRNAFPSASMRLREQSEEYSITATPFDHNDGGPSSVVGGL